MANSELRKEGENGWRRYGKLFLKFVAGKLIIKCPQCSRNIKVDKKELESIISR